MTEPTKNPKPDKNEDHDQERGDLCHSDILEWLQEFRENLVDDRVPERRDSHASSSHEPSLEPEPARSADLGKNSVYTHFPKDRVASAMPCKIRKKSKHGEIRSRTNDFKSKIACILEASESTRMRMEESLPNYHEDHIAGKGDNSLQHYNLVHNFYSYASSNEDIRSKSSS